MNLFCYYSPSLINSSLCLDKFLSLKNANIFSFYSLNRNFTLSLQFINNNTRTKIEDKKTT